MEVSALEVASPVAEQPPANPQPPSLAPLLSLDLSQILAKLKDAQGRVHILGADGKPIAAVVSLDVLAWLEYLEEEEDARRDAGNREVAKGLDYDKLKALAESMSEKRMQLELDEEAADEPR